MQRVMSFTEDQESYRATVRAFLEREVVPFKDQWDGDRLIDRRVYAAAASSGIYGLQIPEQYGGSGESDYRYRMIVCEEIARVNALSFGVTLALQDDLVLDYLLDLATEEQRQRWLPGFASGAIIGALAMTEPGAGSDLRGIKTSARRDGTDWILNGQKTFISSGIMADLVIVAASTDREAGSRGLTLFVVERDMPGFVRGRQLEKMGLPGQDTAELFFEDVQIPAANILGEEGRGLQQLMSHLPRERLGVSASAIATARAMFDQTTEYCRQRQAYGKPLTDLQHVRFELAEMSTQLDVANAFIDQSALAFNLGALTATDAAKGKWFMSELQKNILDRCIQLHGGYGYMMEYPVARAYLDTRIQTIYGGTTEVMKEIIGRELAR